MKKRRFTTLISSIVMSSCLIIGASAASYSDVPNGEWFAEGVRYCSDQGYVAGYSDQTFRPNQNLTRAEMAVIMSNMLDLTSAADVSFRDVPSGQWFTEPILKCVKAGIISGYGDGRFGPNDHVTREQAAVILSNAFGLGREARTTRFQDSGSISDWAWKHVNTMVSHGYMAGMENNRFQPSGKLTRGQIVTIICTHDKDVRSRASLGSEGWKQAYIDYINSGNDGSAWNQDTTYRLIDVDGDGIPELHRIGGAIAQGNAIVGFYHGRLERMDCYAPGLKFDKGTGKFCCCELEGSRDRIAYRFYRLNDGKFTLLHTGYWFSETASRQESWTWDGEVVSGAQFSRLQNSVFIFQDEPDGSFVSKETIIRQIRNY